MNSDKLRDTLLKHTLYFLLFVLPFSVASADDPPFHTELGFKRLSDASTPESLKKASNAVFEIRVVTEEKIEDVRFFDLTDPKLQDFDKKIDSIGALDDKEKYIIKRQAEICREKNKEKQCPVLMTIIKATAFLAGSDGLTLWTNAHVIHPFLKAIADASKKSVGDLLSTHPRLPFFLFDQNGKVVFDPYENEASVAFYPEPSLMAQIRFTWYAEDSDFVGIKLNKKIAEPLEFAKKADDLQMLYRPGYAACTGCPKNPNTTDPLNNEDRGTGKNSEGVGLYWTSGQRQPKEVTDRYFGSSFSIFDVSKMIFFSADAQVGFSGAPILDENGGVVGIFAGSFPKLYAKEMLNMSRGVRPPQFDLMLSQ